MKNIFRFLMAVTVLFTASCAKEDISSSIGGGEVEVTFTANLPELGTRAYGDGTQVNKLRYYVYDNNGTLLSDLSNPDGTGITVGTATKVNLVLLKGMTYNIVFWADHDGYYAYNTAAKTITVDYSTVTANEEWRDAFYAYVTIDPAADDAEEKANVTLRRPFAQLNAISTDDLTAHNNANIKLTTSTVTLDVYNTFNLATGSVDTNSKVLATQLFANNVLDNSLISMNYFFASANEGYTTNVTLDVNYSNGASYSREFTYVPLKQNYRTNIIGQLLSKSTDFTVTIEKNFFEPDKDIVQTAAELQQQIASAQDGEPTEIVLGSDINLNDLLASLGTMSTRTAATPSLTIPASKNITLNLNGCTLSATEDSTGSYALITNKGTLTISDSKGNGKMELTATQNRGWNAYSSVISNQPGGVLTVNGGTIEHLGGTDMAYGIDNLTNGKGTSAVATINGGTVKSTYRAVRQFLNGVEANNSLTVNGGTIEGANKSIWMQDPSKNANTGTLTVGVNASLTGNVYLSVTPDSTEWPVVVSVASAALQGESTVAHGDYLPAGYSVVEENEVWTVKFVPVAKIGDEGYGTLDAAVAAVQDGETITLLKDIEQVDGVIITDKNLTIDLNKKTFTVSEGASTNNRNFKIKGSSIVTIKNGTMVAAGEYSSGAYGTLRTEGTANVTLQNVTLYNYRGNGLNVKALSGTTVTINNTEIYSQYGGGVEAAGGNVVLNNVTIDQKGMYTAPYNSMTISVNGGGTATVNSGTYSTVCLTAEEANNQGTSHGPWCAGVLNSGGKLIINGGTFSNDNFGDNALATYARGLLLADTAANIQINGGTFNALKAIVDVTNNLGDASRNPSVALAGGDFSADPRISGLYASYLISVAEGYEVKEENGRWILNFIPAAKIGETTYNTLQEAIEAIQEGATMELNRDITLTETLVIPADKNFTLNLNGKTLAAADKNTIRNDGGNLTIKNGTVTRTGDIVGYAVNNASGEIVVENATITRGLYTSGSKLTATNANISHDQSSRHAIYAWNCEVTLNSGTYHNDNAGNATLMASGSSVVVVNGGTFSIADGRSTLGWTSCLLDQNSTAQITINNGTFNGGFRVNSTTTKLTINNGSFNDLYGSNYNINNSAEVKVKGGTYTDATAQNFAKKYVAEGYEVNANGEVVAK